MTIKTYEVNLPSLSFVTEALQEIGNSLKERAEKDDLLSVSELKDLAADIQSAAQFYREKILSIKNSLK